MSMLKDVEKIINFKIILWFKNVVSKNDVNILKNLKLLL